VYINAINKWEDGPPADTLQDTQTIEILEDYILAQEKKGVEIRTSSKFQETVTSGGHDEDDPTESLQESLISSKDE
jgi:hypothetical protein